MQYLVESGKTEFVHLVNYPVSNKKELYYPITKKKENQGATRLVKHDLITEEEKQFISGPKIESITIHDMIRE